MKRSKQEVERIMGTRLTVSQSKANKWRTCRAAFNYKYNRKLQRRRVARPLTFGSTVHKVIEETVQGVPKSRLRTSLEGWKDQELSKFKLFTSEVELFEEAFEDAWIIMKEYANFWPRDHLKYLRVNGRKAEHRIEWTPPGEDFTITGVIDAFAKSQNGLKWLVEHKSGKNMMSEDDRWRSLQAALYITVGRELGYPDVDGIVWDMIRSKTPTRPYLKVDGAFSVKKIDSLPSVVAETIKSEGQKPSDYPSLMKNAEESRSNWFQRVFQPVTEDVRSHLYKEFTITAREIVDHHDDDYHPMTIGRHCSWCDYEPICRAIMTGSDPEYVMEKEFTTDAETTAKSPKVSKKDKAQPRKRRVSRRKVARRQKG